MSPRPRNGKCTLCNADIVDKVDYVYHRYLCWGIKYDRKTEPEGEESPQNQSKTVQNNHSTQSVEHLMYNSQTVSSSRSPSRKHSTSVPSSKERCLQKVRLRSKSVDSRYLKESDERFCSNSLLGKKGSLYKFTKSSPDLGSFHKNSNDECLGQRAEIFACSDICKCRKCHRDYTVVGPMRRTNRVRHCWVGCSCSKCHLPVEISGRLIIRPHSVSCCSLKDIDGKNWLGEDEDFGGVARMGLDNKLRTSKLSPDGCSSDLRSVSQRRQRKEVHYFCKPCGVNLDSWNVIRKHIMSSEHLRLSRLRKDPGELSEVDIPMPSEGPSTAPASPRSVCSDRTIWDSMDVASYSKEHLMEGLALMRVQSVSSEAPSMLDSISDVPLNLETPSTPSSMQDQLPEMAQSAEDDSSNHPILSCDALSVSTDKEISIPSMTDSEEDNDTPEPTFGRQSPSSVSGYSLSSFTSLNLPQQPRSMLRLSLSNCQSLQSPLANESVLAKRKMPSTFVRFDYKKLKAGESNVVELVRFRDCAYSVQKVDTSDLPSVYVNLGKRCDLQTEWSNCYSLQRSPKSREKENFSLPLGLGERVLAMYKRKSSKRLQSKMIRVNYEKAKCQQGSMSNDKDFNSTLDTMDIVDDTDGEPPIVPNESEIFKLLYGSLPPLESDHELVIDASSLLDRLVKRLNDQSLVCTNCDCPLNCYELLKQLYN